MIKKQLLDSAILDNELPLAIERFLRWTNKGGKLYGFRPFVTLSQALDLYDRLMNSGLPWEIKMSMIYTLTQEIDVFHDVALVVGAIPVPRQSGMHEFKPPEGDLGRDRRHHLEAAREYA